MELYIPDLLSRYGNRGSSFSTKVKLQDPLYAILCGKDFSSELRDELLEEIRWVRFHSEIAKKTKSC